MKQNNQKNRNHKTQNQHMEAAYERRAKICALATNMHADKTYCF